VATRGVETEAEAVVAVPEKSKLAIRRPTSVAHISFIVFCVLASKGEEDVAKRLFRSTGSCNE
jgi:hypothetical protein